MKYRGRKYILEKLVIKEITETMERVLHKDPKLTHIVIEEVDTDNWGYSGITTTEYRKQLSESKP